MKRILILNLLILIPFLLKSQVLGGTVYDQSNKLPVPYATVYYGGSAIGTTTGENGDFIIPAKTTNIPLIVSCIGYQTATIKEYAVDVPLKIYLKPKVSELKEVVIKDDGIPYKEKVELFKREFLGISPNSKNCRILNLDDLNLRYDKDEKTLTASSDKPLEIENRSLGYHIRYFLDKFIKAPTGVIIEGNFIFKEIPELAAQERTIKNREKAYRGSRMHFIRALYSNALEQNGFKLTTRGWNKPVNPDSVLQTDSAGRKLLRLPGNLAISYNSSFTFLSQNAKVSIIDESGFHDVTLKWAGKMGEHRIADMLPFDYQRKGEAGGGPVAGRGEVGSRGRMRESLRMTDHIGVLIERPFFEKVYLHTDRDLFGQGDTLWYKAYVTDARNHQLIDSSANLYVELVSLDSGAIVGKQVIRIEEGLGRGDFTIDETVPAGNYQLRAYTRWMLNFDDLFIFEKDITVLNTSKAVEQKASITKDSTIRLSGSAEKTDKAQKKQAISVRFFPEGGQLVEGLNSIVAIKAEDGSGLGVSVRGAVFDKKGNVVDRFSTDSLGFGLLPLKPLKDQLYTASIEGFEPSAIFSLPKPLSKGASMRVSTKDSVLSVLVVINDFDVQGEEIKEYALVGRHRGQVYYLGDIQLNASENLIKISMSLFPEGIVTFTLFDAANRPVCERLAFVHHPGNKPAILLSTDKKTYRPQESVRINIKSPLSARLSMAVVDAAVEPVPSGSILSYLMLQSEIRGRIEQPDRYFDVNNPERLKQLDLLLLTQGWREFVWRRLADSTIHPRFPVEHGIQVAGKISDKTGTKPLAGMSVSLFANAARGTKLFSTKADSLGQFSFPGIHLYEQQLVKLVATDSKGEKKGVIVLDSVPQSLIPVPAMWSDTRRVSLKSPEIPAALFQRIKQARDRSIQLKEVKINASRDLVAPIGNYFDWGAMQSFDVRKKDYSSQTLGGWILAHVKGAIPDAKLGVAFRGIGPVFRKGDVKGGLQLMAPAIVVDQQSHSDENRQRYSMSPFELLNMSIEKVTRVVVRPTAGFKIVSGTLVPVEQYFLYLTFKKGALDVPVQGSLQWPVSGYYNSRNFYAPGASQDLPGEFRNTLHWEPLISTNKDGEASVTFNNPNQTTAARIIVQGITEDGQPVFAVGSYLIGK